MMQKQPQDPKRQAVLRFLGALLALALLGAMFHWRAAQNYALKNSGGEHRSNFFTFWLAGRMLLRGEDPYNEAQYLAGHDEFNVKWKPNKIFPYPLPLALLMIPLGTLPLGEAYFALQYFTQISVALVVYLLLRRWRSPAHERLLAPLMAFFLFFSPLLLTLQVGSIGALALLILFGAQILLERGKSRAAGIALALLMLKPPQGAAILLPASVWLLARKDRKALEGIALGGIGLLLVGMTQKPQWVLEFIQAGQAVMNRTQGVQSNVWSYAYLACGGAQPCAGLLGGFAAALLLGLTSLFLWRNSARLAVWEAFNFIIPVAFVSTLYLWVYDQILYVIPIVWIVGSMVERFKNYVYAFLFIALLWLFSFGAMVYQGYAAKDTLNVGATLLTLGATALLDWLNQKRPLEKS